MNLTVVSKHQVIRHWVLLSLFWFLLVALMGLLLRYILIWPIDGFVFGNILHSHSHLAFLGWMYGGLYSLLVYHYIPDSKIKFYNDLFWFTQISVIGMIISFAWQAYGLYSITFSSLHMLLAYFFVFKFYKDIKEKKRDTALLFSIAALFLMVISTLGPLSLGIAGALKAGTKTVMDLLINFYLHFQINGWFIFAVIGLFLHYLIGKGIILNETKLKIFFWLMLASVVPAYALSAVWTVSNNYIFIIGSLAALMQISALIIFLSEILKPASALRMGFNYFRYVLGFILMLFILKNILQLFSIVPDFAIIISKIRLLVVGYLHLVLLGICSLFVLIAFALSGFVKKSKSFLAGISLLIFGIIVTEALMFTQAFYFIKGWGVIQNFNQLLFYSSAILPAGIFIILINSIFVKKQIIRSAIQSHMHPTAPISMDRLRNKILN
jgi:hypothetical protein